MDAKDVLDQASLILDLARCRLKAELSDLPSLRQKDYQVLEYIWKANPDHSVRMADLTHFMNVSPAATSQLINSYEAMGVARRVRSSADRRANFVQIDPSLLELINSKAKQLEVICGQMLDELDPQEAAALERVLNLLTEKLKDAQDHA